MNIDGKEVLFCFTNGHDMQFALISIGLLGVVILSCKLGVIVSHMCQLTLSGRYVANHMLPC